MSESKVTIEAPFICQELTEQAHVFALHDSETTALYSVVNCGIAL